MTLFDIAGGLVLIVSALAGWIRGGTREVAWVAAFVLAAVISLFALRYSGPIARHAIHTVWMANVVAILVLFLAAYILLRVIAAAFTRSLHRTNTLGGLDRAAGAAFGVIRGLAILGLANLVINAITPADRMPHWISGAMLYPLSDVSAQTLKKFAPQGATLARQVGPTIGHAVEEDDTTNSAENRGYNDKDAEPKPPALRVETSR
jgi:membrane protein required for colicin V production